MSEPVNDGGNAFPMPLNESTSSCSPCGMSLRDWFAGMALQGLVQRNQVRFFLEEKEPDFDPNLQKALSEYATASFNIADAMLKQREQKP